EMSQTIFSYLVFVFIIQIHISVQQVGKTSNDEIKDIILNFEHRLGEKMNNLDAKMSDLQIKLELMEKSLRNVSDDLALIKDTHKDNNLKIRLTLLNECPLSEGFFRVPKEGGQCYKLFSDANSTWSEAETKCKSEGLALAEPADDVALVLRMHIVLKLSGGGGNAWVGGVYDGSTYRFVRNQARQLATDSALLNRGESFSDDFTEYHCLYLGTTSWFAPHKAYGTSPCINPSWTLCEVVMP
ncbi:unnamed protein product, partial [Meganyctiphanes norvegica]